MTRGLCPSPVRPSGALLRPVTARESGDSPPALRIDRDRHARSSSPVDAKLWWRSVRLHDTGGGWQGGRSIAICTRMNEPLPIRPRARAQARLDPRQSPHQRGFAETRADAQPQPRHGVRGSGVPEYRRVLDQEARHGDDPGRHLHARLRVLQRQDRHAARGRSAGAAACRRCRRGELGLEHIVVTSVDRDDLKDGGASQFVKVIEALRARHPTRRSRS
jgi:hypothetical protein